MGSSLAWIILSGIAMSAIALVGSVTLLLGEAHWKRWVKPLVAFAAGALVGGALFHMLPGALNAGLTAMQAMASLAAGFTLFFALEQFLHLHHCHQAHAECKQPLTYLILLGDGLHNFLGGLAIGSMFLLDIRLGLSAWLAAAAHEVPQELGDYAVLRHGGWGRLEALGFNVLSGLTFLLGGLLAYVMAGQLDLRWLIPFAAGNFLYIGASDLVPEVNRARTPRENLQHFAAFLSGLGGLYALAWMGA
jgi:zinc and cadmium transporter